MGENGIAKSIEGVVEEFIGFFEGTAVFVFAEFVGFDFFEEVDRIFCNKKLVGADCGNAAGDVFMGRVNVETNAVDEVDLSGLG